MLRNTLTTKLVPRVHFRSSRKHWTRFSCNNCRIHWICRPFQSYQFYFQCRPYLFSSRHINHAGSASFVERYFDTFRPAAPGTKTTPNGLRRTSSKRILLRSQLTLKKTTLKKKQFDFLVSLLNQSSSI